MHNVQYPQHIVNQSNNILDGQLGLFEPWPIPWFNLPVASDAAALAVTAANERLVPKLTEEQIAAAFVSMLDVCDSDGRPSVGDGNGLVSGHISPQASRGSMAGLPRSPGRSGICAQTGEIHNRRSGPSRVGRDVADVVIVPGGMMLSGVNLGGAQTAGGGGRRGIIKGFTRPSQRNYMDKLMMLDWLQLVGSKHGKKAVALFNTLTYSREWPSDWRTWKRQLEAFRMRLERSPFGLVGATWRLEFQKRGAPHFHLLTMFPKKVSVRAFRLWLSRAWNDVIDGGEDNLKVGCNSRQVYGSPDKLLCYLSKYLTKVVHSADTEEQPTGRLWGFWGSLPTKVLGVVTFHSFGQYEAFLASVRAWGTGSPYLQTIHVLSRCVRVYGDGLDLLNLALAHACVVAQFDGDELPPAYYKP
jgi:hypothetical protein